MTATTLPTTTPPCAVCHEPLRRFHRVWLGPDGGQLHWNGEAQRMEPHAPVKTAAKRRVS